MNKELKSLLSSLGVILIYFYATAGIVKLLWNTDDDNVFTLRVKFLVTLSFLFSFIYIIGIYYIVGPYYVEKFYEMFIIAQLIYIGIGIVVNLLIPRK